MAALGFVSFVDFSVIFLCERTRNQLSTLPTAEEIVINDFTVSGK